MEKIDTCSPAQYLLLLALLSLNLIEVLLVLSLNICTPGACPDKQGPLGATRTALSKGPDSVSAVKPTDSNFVQFMHVLGTSK